MIKMNQDQNEAIARLMIFAEFQDKKISITEGEMFYKHIEMLDWKSGTDPDLFIMKETANVRKALETEDSGIEFIERQCSAFSTDKEKEYCINTVEALILSDGIDARESVFLQKLRSALNK